MPTKFELVVRLIREGVAREDIIRRVGTTLGTYQVYTARARQRGLLPARTRLEEPRHSIVIPKRIFECYDREAQGRGYVGGPDLIRILLAIILKDRLLDAVLDPEPDNDPTN